MKEFQEPFTYIFPFFNKNVLAKINKYIYKSDLYLVDFHTQVTYHYIKVYKLNEVNQQSIFPFMQIIKFPLM